MIMKNSNEIGHHMHLKKENSLLLAQLQAVQQELVKEIHESQEHKTRYQSLTAIKETLDKQLEALKDTLTKQTSLREKSEVRYHQKSEENIILIEQLLEVQLELERISNNKEQCDSELTKLNNKHRLLQHRLVRVSETSQYYLRELQEAREQLINVRNQLYHDKRQHILALFSVYQSRVRSNGKSVKRILFQERKNILASGLFDEDWYRKQYSDVAEADMDPVEHYLTAGAEEGRDPGPKFNTVWYLMNYKDVVISGVNPLLHYIRFGYQEERVPYPNQVALSTLTENTQDNS